MVVTPIAPLCTTTAVKLYCPEQIKIPDILPSLLKNYAKAAIRTQPYDLLRWSTEYFRALANNEKPMAKCRLEKLNRYGSLTQGYVRVLIDKLGKGFFINCNVLEKHWRALCLPQEELMKFLSLCRMLRWTQVHWLKLLAVLIASLNKSLMATMEMVCMLLTDDVEGGPARIPIWMFVVIYKYLADLDCSEEQQFICGRKVMPGGCLEPVAENHELPYIFSTASLKKAIIDQCDDDAFSMTSDVVEKPLEMEIANCTDVNFTDAMEFKAFGRNDDPVKFLRKCHDFSTLILYIQKTQSLPKIGDFEGPYNIDVDAMQKARENEEMTMGLRENHALCYTNDVRKSIYKDQVNLMRDMGPPWSWVYDFVNSSCIDKSYNMVELQSVASDITPTQSSDESFDYDKRKPIHNNDPSSVSSVSTYETANESVEGADSLQDLLLVEKMKSASKEDIKEQLEVLGQVLKQPENKKKIESDGASGVVDIICKEGINILKKAGEKCDENYLDLPLIMDIMRQAESAEIKFHSMDDVLNYIETKYFMVYERFVKPPIEGKSVRTTPGPSEFDPNQSDLVSDWGQQMGANFGAGKLDDSKPEDRTCEDLDPYEPKPKEPECPRVEGYKRIQKPKQGKGEAAAAKDKMELIYEQSNIMADEAALKEKVESLMIVGLVDPTEEEDEPAEEEQETQSEITEDQKASSFVGYKSDDSSIFVMTNSGSTFRVFTPTESNLSLCPSLNEFKCKIPAMPGIGPKISTHIVKEFLKYIKFRAMQQSGMVMPRNLREDKCPLLIDPQIKCSEYQPKQC